MDFYRRRYGREDQNSDWYGYRGIKSENNGSKGEKCDHRSAEDSDTYLRRNTCGVKDATSQIVETVHGILEKTPPELAADIVDRGIVLTGGGALLHGMDTLIEQRTGVSTLTVQDAMSVVAVGTGKYAEVMARFDG